MDPKEFVAEDTVMNEKEIAQAYQKGRDEADSPIDEGAAWKVIAKAQAEISFKAGMEHGDKKAYECGVYNGEAEGLAKGIKEVVGISDPYLRSLMEMVVVMKNLNITPTETTIKNIMEIGRVWQAKKKEWEIEE